MQVTFHPPRSSRSVPHRSGPQQPLVGHLVWSHVWRRAAAGWLQPWPPSPNVQGSREGGEQVPSSTGEVELCRDWRCWWGAVRPSPGASAARFFPRLLAGAQGGGGRAHPRGPEGRGEGTAVGAPPLAPLWAVFLAQAVPLLQQSHMSRRVMTFLNKYILPLFSPLFCSEGTKSQQRSAVHPQ